MLDLYSLFVGDAQYELTRLIENLDTNFIWGFAKPEEVKEFTPADIALMRDAFDKVMDYDPYCVSCGEDTITEIRRKLHCKGGIYLSRAEVAYIQEALSQYVGPMASRGLFDGEEREKVEDLSRRLFKYSIEPDYDE